MIQSLHGQIPEGKLDLITELTRTLDFIDSVDEEDTPLSQPLLSPADASPNHLAFSESQIHQKLSYRKFALRIRLHRGADSRTDAHLKSQAKRMQEASAEASTADSEISPASQSVNEFAPVEVDQFEESKSESEDREVSDSEMDAEIDLVESSEDAELDADEISPEENPDQWIGVMSSEEENLQEMMYGELFKDGVRLILFCSDSHRTDSHKRRRVNPKDGNVACDLDLFAQTDSDWNLSGSEDQLAEELTLFQSVRVFHNRWLQRKSSFNVVVPKLGH